MERLGVGVADCDHLLSHGGNWNAEPPHSTVYCCAMDAEPFGGQSRVPVSARQEFDESLTIDERRIAAPAIEIPSPLSENHRERFRV